MDTLYIIASLKHTSRNNEHITFWGPDYRGYVIAVTDERVGKYTADFIAKGNGNLNNGADSIAIPEDVVKSLLTPTPHYASNGRAAQFYDIAGPVVDNTRSNWNKLIAASMADHRRYKPKPEVFRGNRRSFALPAAPIVKE